MSVPQKREMAGRQAKRFSARYTVFPKDFLPGIQYFHVVFTMPHKLNPLALRNQKIVYNSSVYCIHGGRT